jgi:hypothetical protein
MAVSVVVPFLVKKRLVVFVRAFVSLLATKGAKPFNRDFHFWAHRRSASIPQLPILDPPALVQMFFWSIR